MVVISFNRRSVRQSLKVKSTYDKKEYDFMKTGFQPPVFDPEQN